jgi:broad specificity phosphatase PhoE
MMAEMPAKAPNLPAERDSGLEWLQTPLAAENRSQGLKMGDRLAEDAARNRAIFAERWRTGETLASLASRYGLSVGRVSQIYTREFKRLSKRELGRLVKDDHYPGETVGEWVERRKRVRK